MQLSASQILLVKSKFDPDVFVTQFCGATNCLRDIFSKFQSVKSFTLYGDFLLIGDVFDTPQFKSGLLVLFNLGWFIIALLYLSKSLLLHLHRVDLYNIMFKIASNLVDEACPLID